MTCLLLLESRKSEGTFRLRPSSIWSPGACLCFYFCLWIQLLLFPCLSCRKPLLQSFPLATGPWGLKGMEPAVCRAAGWLRPNTPGPEHALRSTSPRHTTRRESLGIAVLLYPPVTSACLVVRLFLSLITPLVLLFTENPNSRKELEDSKGGKLI